MAPSSTSVEDDPITAEYDIYLTPPTQQETIYLLQYPNRPRDRPYNARLGVAPREMRIKPNSAHLELDVNLSTDHNFNKYRGLQWGEAMRAGRELQGGSEGGATFGLAAGFFGRAPGGGGGGGMNLQAGAGGGVPATGTPGGRKAVLKDEVDLEHDIQNDLATFHDAEQEEKVMHTQTLGGQILPHDSPHEAGKPVYFVGAFRGKELHLSKVKGTVQMRPLFHHLDAEDWRGRVSASRAAAAAAAAPSAPSSDMPGTHANAGAIAGGSGSAAGDVARIVHQAYKPATTNPKGELETREQNMKSALQAAHEEPWVKMDYVDEDDDEAYRVWNERMFLKGTSEEEGGCVRLRSAMGDEEYLDAVSAPGRESPMKRRRRTQKKKGGGELEDGEDGGAGGG